MNKMILTPKKLTAESFSQFGQVISCENKDYEIINDGYAKKYPDLAEIDTQEDSGKTALNIFIAKKRLFPLKIEMLEKHPFFSQAFIPRDDTPFLVVVAPASARPRINDIEVFISSGEQGVNYARGVWHFPLISIKDDANFVVIDRKYTAESDKLEQCIVYPIKDTDISIEFEL
ncbi:MAG: ureidoglycolate lyase [Gammaproteobacteria bacterium]|jgi:ureidoglycolate lyase|nr:ureidoglycolate lyase [Gammaproteobacteria bacterium]MDP6973664.1 ureidoglycolate lyase [Gammaproteobacteria bacterium]